MHGCEQVVPFRRERSNGTIAFLEPSHDLGVLCREEPYRSPLAINLRSHRSGMPVLDPVEADIIVMSDFNACQNFVSSS